MVGVKWRGGDMRLIGGFGSIEVMLLGFLEMMGLVLVSTGICNDNGWELCSPR